MSGWWEYHPEKLTTKNKDPNQKIVTISLALILSKNEKNLSKQSTIGTRIKNTWNKAANAVYPTFLNISSVSMTEFCFFILFAIWNIVPPPNNNTNIKPTTAKYAGSRKSKGICLIILTKTQNPQAMNNIPRNFKSFSFLIFFFLTN